MNYTMVFYGKIYIIQIKGLKLYFEIELGNTAMVNNNQAQGDRGLGFNSETG